MKKFRKKNNVFYDQLFFLHHPQAISVVKFVKENI